jgi:acetylornithine/succinyldiaminopimelate/putrescine aminotransferase
MLTKRHSIVAMAEGFHGRTMGALSATGLGHYRDYGGPVLPATFVPFGDLAAAERAVGPDTAAVLLEPIPSMGGVRVAPAEYYRGLRRLCDGSGALLVFDEIQTGLGRTGRMWAGEHFGVTPDMQTLAKGIASGVPCGAVLFQGGVASRVKAGDHGSTFGGGPLACAALEATLAVIRDERLVERAAESGEAIRQGALRIAGVREVRGLGLLVAIICEADAKAVLARLRESRVLASSVSSDPKAVRLLPPLTAGPAEVEEFLAALHRARPDRP